MMLMPKNEQNETKNDMKEAAELLDCMAVDEDKLQRIASALSDDVKEDSRVKNILEKIGQAFEPQENQNSFENFFMVLERENIIPLVEELLISLGENPAIIENIEKKILPILFSK